MAQNMGIGALGGQSLVLKRKFRWTLRLDIPNGGSVPENFVSLASRPNITIDETEVNFLNAKTFIPGKATWETITITYLDVASGANAPLYSWLASVYDFTNKDTLKMASKRQDYAATGTLTMFDGCGAGLEEWTLNDLWPTAVNWGDLDYASTDIATIELTCRYSSVQYKSLCGGVSIKPTCTAC